MSWLAFAVFITHADDAVTITKAEGQVRIAIGKIPFATYVWNDPKVMRPYFCQVHAPNGAQVSRSYPPDPVLNKDNADHETMHPGVWLAFGDINGLDVWRNKATVRHLRIVEEPEADADHGTFTVLNAYAPLEPANAKPILYETCQYDVYALDSGWFLVSRSVFQSPDNEIRFGDQEEMGLGMRVQTPLTVKYGGGHILNSAGGQNEEETWGKTADWCSAFGTVNGETIGMTLMPAPGNFRQSWFHSRDYGLLVANPFGRKAMTAPDNATVAADSTVVTKGTPFKLTYGVFVFASKKSVPDNATAYEWFKEILGDGDEPQTPLEVLGAAGN